LVFPAVPAEVLELDPPLAKILQQPLGIDEQTETAAKDQTVKTKLGNNAFHCPGREAILILVR
jgi:hypothetical protein